MVLLFFSKRRLYSLCALRILSPQKLFKQNKYNVQRQRQQPIPRVHYDCVAAAVYDPLFTTNDHFQNGFINANIVLIAINLTNNVLNAEQKHSSQTNFHVLRSVEVIAKSIDALICCALFPYRCAISLAFERMKCKVISTHYNLYINFVVAFFVLAFGFLFF